MHREVKRVLEIPAVRGPLEDRFAMNVVAGTPPGDSGADGAQPWDYRKR